LVLMNKQAHISGVQNAAETQNNGNLVVSVLY